MKRLIFLVALTLFKIDGYAQKQSLKWDDVLDWKRVSQSTISNNGDYVAIGSRPWIGDATMTIFSSNGEKLTTIERGESLHFVGKERAMLTITPAKKLVDSLKLKKTKSSKMPVKSLMIYNLTEGKESVIDSLQDIKYSTKHSQWVAYRTGKKKILTVTDFERGGMTLNDATSYSFFDKEGFFAANIFVKDSISEIVIYNLSKKSIVSKFNVPDTLKATQYNVNSRGEVALITKGDNLNGSENKLFYWDGKKLNNIAINNIEEGWIVNENERPAFSENLERLYFGVSPKYPVKDSTKLDSDKAKVDVWVWNEPKLKTQQVIDRYRDIKQSYKAVYEVESGKVTQIANKEIPYTYLIDRGDSDYALLYASAPYEMEKMWTGRPKKDIYLKNIKTGVIEQLYKGLDCYPSTSPEGNYIYWYHPQDSSWNAYSLEGKKALKLTSPDKIKAYNDSSNVPDIPGNYGSMGWSEKDGQFFIYDKYDIWMVDLSGKNEPKRITDGYKTATTYRYIRLDSEKRNFAKNDKILLSQFDNNTKKSGYAELILGKEGSLKSLIKDGCKFSRLSKAKNSDKIIFAKENFETFPDIYSSNLNFDGKEVKLSDLNPQQSKFNWGKPEMISWVSLDGDTLKGILYKPENFDPAKKYPMICNFYERSSDGFYGYRMPEPHRSTIDYHYYTSNGYVIFNPDMKYKDGYPGESCYNSLMPGISKVLEMGFVDPKRIGAQGHSWGGYQVAYLATRTNLFAAIESGAPVVNMVSAYGGIRWATGLNRAFQYEAGQSRIGESPWEAPLKYLENSPIFTMDKVTTPILIMHNDKDGHVPWWQGIEYFIALRRLEKPVWLLNYNNEPHWPLRMPNQIDFQKRMGQFFDFYLKDGQRPEWMDGESCSL